MEKYKKKKLELCFALHVDYNHFDILLKNKISEICKNIFSKIYNSPEIPFTIAVSGNFMENTQKEADVFCKVLSEMLDRKQIEILGGAFYEPYFSLIPPSDLSGQIELMTDFLRKHFNRRPRGAFIPFSEWNQNLVYLLKKCGMEYCLLDTRLFERASLNPYSPACLEDNGKTIFALPSITIHEDLSSISPLKFYEKMLIHAGEEEHCLTVFLSFENTLKLFDGGKEKKSWFAEFLDITMQENSEITLSTTDKLLKSKKIYQKAVISPNAVLKNKTIDGSIKKLFIKDSGLYLLYSKILYVHTLCSQIRGDKPRKKTALIDLWKSENANLFNLDGTENGLYYSAIQYCYRNLLLAEKQTRIPGVFSSSLINYDFDMDGVKEFLSQKENMNMYVHNSGGKIFELDIFSVYKNYVMQEEDSGMFIDHLVCEKELEKIKNGNTAELKKNPVFSENFYQDIKLDRIKFELMMKTEGNFKNLNNAVSLKKQYLFLEQGVQVQYILKNESNSHISAYFISEICLDLNFYDKKQSSISIYSEDKKKEIPLKLSSLESVSWIRMGEMDDKVKFTIEANENFNFILIPVYKNGEGELKNIVGVRMFFYWKTELAACYETEKMIFFTADIQKNEKNNKNKRSEKND